MKELDYKKYNKLDEDNEKEIIYREYKELRLKKDKPTKERKSNKENFFEISFYSNKITKENWLNFFKTLSKRDVPVLDVIDFSTILPLRPIKLVIKKNVNTIRIYLKERPNGGEDFSALIFPLKLSEKESIPLKKGFPLGLKIIKNLDLFTFLVKENIEEITLEIKPTLGKYTATGVATRKDGSRKAIFLTNPEKFLEIDLEKNPSFYLELIEKPLLKSIYMDSEDPIFESKGANLGIDNFDAFKHSLIVGMSGSGKSKFIYILTKAIKKKYGRKAKVVLIDPHGEFSKIFKDQAKIIDFKKEYIEPLEIGRETSPMTTQLIENLIMSIIGQRNKYADRVLFYSIHLLSSIGELKLQNISKLLTDSPARMEYLNKSENEEVKRFFSTEFDDIYINHFNDAVLPILNFIGEYELYMGKQSKSVSLLDEIQKNEVTIISFDPHFFGRKMIKFLAGAVMQQMYVLSVTHKFNDPTVLIVDEFPIVETAVVKNIHAETRKFNLHLYLSMQYLNQLNKEIVDSILTNVYNYIVFKCNRQDANMISSIMDIKVEEYFKKHRQPSELEEEKKDLFINLTTRECVVRLFDGAKHLMPVKVFVSDSKNWDGVFLPKPTDEPPPPTIQETKNEETNILKFKKDDHEILRGED